MIRFDWIDRLHTARYNYEYAHWQWYIRRSLAEAQLQNNVSYGRYQEKRATDIDGINLSLGRQ